MLNAVAAAAEEMTGAAVLPSGPLDAHGDGAPIRRVVGFLVSGKHHFFRGGVSRSRREFFIRSGLLVTDEAVHLGLVSKIKIFPLPSVACVA